MAEESVFVSKNSYPFFEEIHVNIEWFGGFALSQKRKCETGLHQSFLHAYPSEKSLEISSTSLMYLGTRLSAMNLSKRTKTGLTTVESAFQSSRIYFDGGEQIGPFPEFLFLPGKECKRLVKEASHGLHSYRYEFDGVVFPAPRFHISLFYDFLYINALLEEENKEAARELLEGKYSAFTDLATKSLNSQARSCAIFAGLAKAGVIDQVRDYQSYLRLFRVTESGQAVDSSAYENVQLLTGKNGVQLLSPVVPCYMGKDTVEEYYRVSYPYLTNKKNDPENYVDAM